MMVALVQDLFFAARVQALAQGSGVEAKITTSSAEFLGLLADLQPTHVLLDLSLVTEVILSQVSDVAHVAAFGPHVQREKFLAARRQGIKTLWANSALPERLPAWLLQS
ncbi:MAG: hypothetical protein ACYCOU_05690 [Sulfobacillus sp.]